MVLVIDKLEIHFVTGRNCFLEGGLCQCVGAQKCQNGNE